MKNEGSRKFLTGKYLALILALTLAAFISCGGGGGGDSDPISDSGPETGDTDAGLGKATWGKATWGGSNWSE